MNQRRTKERPKNSKLEKVLFIKIGISFAFLGVGILPASSLIGATTFTLSALGVWLGHVFGARFKSKAEILGGAVLILLGLKILLEHLNILVL